MTPFLIPFFVQPRKWVWIYGIVLIALGMTSICFLPFLIPLLIFWCKPEVRGWYEDGNLVRK
jgi:1-acyl-sn-glycerol-3-phosphate acyltransferase